MERVCDKRIPEKRTDRVVGLSVSMVVSSRPCGCHRPLLVFSHFYPSAAMHVGASMPAEARSYPDGVL
jgi:hypothetical protein